MSYFTELCNKHGTDKGTVIRECHGYSYVYEKLFEPIKNNNIKLLEIGIHDPLFPGASLRVYSEYFPNATILGFDVIDCSHFNIDRVYTFKGNSMNDEDYTAFLNFDSRPFDVIIDDGEHRVEYQLKGFNKLFPFLKEGGVYIIEDLHAHSGNATRLYFQEEKNYEHLKAMGVRKTELCCNGKLLIIYK